MVVSPDSLQALEKCEHVVFIVGMSGAGKTSACNAFSDSGYFVIDNLPVMLTEQLFRFMSEEVEKFKRTVLLLTVDNDYQLTLALELHQIVRNKIGAKSDLIFLDAEDSVLLRRYNETRRPHPFFRFGAHLGLEEAISGERALLFPAKDQANFIIDTSRFTVHDVKREVRRFLEERKNLHAHRLTVHWISFGFKHGVPFDCNIIQDVRFLPNPYFVPELRGESGKNPAVRSYVFKDGAADDYLSVAAPFLAHSLEGFYREGRAYTKIGVGCTGGKHRSVALAEELIKRLSSEHYLFFLTHRDIALSTEQ